MKPKKPTPTMIKARLKLLCRVAQKQTFANTALEKNLAALEKLIRHDLQTLARTKSPNNFHDLLFTLEQELTAFREFCQFPALAHKTIIGFGGGFSAGKSSLINALLQKKWLVTEVDPTTSLPSFIFQAEQEQIVAFNLFGQKLELSPEEFKSLTHGEAETYQSDAGAWLKTALISSPDFAWEHLALLDTPGYSKPEDSQWNTRTDEHIARAQLNTAHAILWAVSADNGTISEADLSFLATLNPDIPRLILVTRADKKTPEDIAAIVNTITRTLQDRALPFTGVQAVSTRPSGRASLEALYRHLEEWNLPQGPDFALNFKRPFVEYTRFFEAETHKLNFRLNQLNRVASLSEQAETQRDMEELKTLAETEKETLKTCSEQLEALQNAFFTQLAQIGEQMHIPLREPERLETEDYRFRCFLSYCSSRTKIINI